MTERDAQIRFERQLMRILPNYSTQYKVSSDTIFFYINKAKEEYIKQLYMVFQQNQETSDKLRTLVTTKNYTLQDFVKQGNKFSTDYPEDYMYALGEQVYIRIINNQCPNLIVKTSDVLEATIETVDKILNNSLSEHHLNHNQAKPVRVYVDNKIILYTDGKYDIDSYRLTYLKKSNDLGKNLTNEYNDLPDYSLKEIVDLAVQDFVNHITATNNKTKE